ncbi:hypothetical protein Tco_1397337, partial [Tanacetum coccineum]
LEDVEVILVLVVAATYLGTKGEDVAHLRTKKWRRYLCEVLVVISDGMDIDPVEAVIEACFDFADIIRASGVDVRVEAVTIARDNVETGTRDPIMVSDDEDTPPVVPEVIPEPAQEGAAGCTYETLGDLIQRFHDHTQAIPVHRIQAMKGVQREQGHRIVRVDSAVTTLTERVAELERDNRRLKGTASVESQRVDRLQRGMFCIQRELRQIRRLRFYDRVRVGRLKACARKHIGYRP